MSHAPNAHIASLPPCRPIPRFAADPISFLHAHHRLQLAFCETLDLFAHDLHRPATRKFAAGTLRNLISELRLHQIYEDHNLCAAMVIDPAILDDAFEMLELVAEGHQRDGILANEILKAFEKLGERHSVPESTGSFFGDVLTQFTESLRRHIAWEERVALPFAADHLPQMMRAALVARMREQRTEWPDVRREQWT